MLIQGIEMLSTVAHELHLSEEDGVVLEPKVKKTLQ